MAPRLGLEKMEPVESTVFLLFVFLFLLFCFFVSLFFCFFCFVSPFPEKATRTMEDTLEPTFLDETSPPSTPTSTPAILRARSLSPTKRAPSAVWKYFNDLPDCRICKLCSSAKKWSKNTSTRTLGDHLKLSHPHLTRDLLQPTIGEALTLPIRGEQKEELDRALIGWIVEDFQAFNVTASPAFKEFLALLNPKSVFYCCCFFLSFISSSFF